MLLSRNQVVNDLKALAMSDIKQLSSRVVYQNPWMTVREDKILRPSGAEGIYGVVDKPDFVVIAPIDNSFVHIVEQYRYPVQARQWELPQGSWEPSHDSEHEDVAKRELLEETGLIANRLVYVGFQYLAYGFCSQGYHIYLATELTLSASQLDPEEEDLITKKVSVSVFEEMLRSGVIQDATTLNAYSLIKMKGLI